MRVEAFEYINENGFSPFGKWFDKLNAGSAARITTAIARMQTGNLSNCKNLGQGVWENKLNFGPGYRVYFGKQGDSIVILLMGGTKSRQSEDITKAKQYWQEYKTRRRNHHGTN